MSIVPLTVYSNSENNLGEVSHDTYTDDSQLRLKARDLNLIKHNPNLFTNRSGAHFRYMVGGEKTILMTLGCGVLGLLYRRRVNALRGVSPREGVWFNTLYFLFGASLGTFYSSVFFFRWQVLFNDYFAHYLLKRYKGSAQLNRTNIYRLKDVENTDECYVFCDSYFNNFHM